MKELKNYRKACEDIGKVFAKKYFGKDCENWFVADDVTGVMYVNDFFFNIDDMYEYLKCRYSCKKIIERYYQEMAYIEEKNSRDGFPNIKNWIKLNK